MRKFPLAGFLLLIGALALSQDLFRSSSVPVPSREEYLLQKLTPRDRIQDFQTAWEAIRDNYYDPAMNGVDWQKVYAQYVPKVAAVKSDQEFYEVLERMAGELHDAHTHILSPTQAENFRKHQHASLGFGVQIVEGKPAVTRVVPDSEAARAGVVPGMIVTTVDGKPVAQRLEAAAANVPESSSERATRHFRFAYVFRGDPGTTVKVGFERADGSRFETALKHTLEDVTPQLSARPLPSGNAYINFRVFYPPAAQDFQRAVQQFHDAPGLIIDLRHNPGGSSDQLFAIAGNFFSSKTELARARTRERGAVPAYVTIDHKASTYTGPVVVLVGEQSGSSSELFTAGMQTVGRVKVVGTRTCGCVLGTNRLVNLNSGGQVMISRVLWSAAGRKLEGDGVIPDKLVPLTLADIRNGRDVALEEADRLLKEMSPAAAAHKAGQQ